MEIDFRKFTELYKQNSLEFAYHGLTDKEYPKDDMEGDAFIASYLKWLAENQAKLHKDRKLSFQSPGMIKIPECILTVKRLKYKGLKSLTTILDYRSFQPFCQVVFADRKKLIASDAHKLVIIDNRENLPDGSLTNPKTGERIDFKYPNYQSIIPKYTESVEFDMPYMVSVANNAACFSENTVHAGLVVFDLGVYRLAITAKNLLQTMLVLLANGSKTVRMGYHASDPLKPVTFDADNGNFALIMPFYVNWEDSQILGTVIRADDTFNHPEQEEKTEQTMPAEVKTISEEPIIAQPVIKNRKSEFKNEVTEIPLAVIFIKTYCGWNSKVKTKTQVYAFIKRLQKAITEKRIRKISEYASQIEYMQNRLVAFYNNMKSETKTYEIPESKLSELKAKCNMRWADHVVVIGQFINILNDTKTGLKDKATVLLKKIESCSFPKESKEAIADITKSLKDYLSGKTDAPQLNEMQLQGLFGLAGLSGLGNLPNMSANMSPVTNDNKILSAADFKNASFNLMGFTGKWLQLIGNPATPFKMMLWGTGGSGKSTLAIEFARYLAGALNKRVLYVANEEGAGATLHEKMTRLNAFHPNLFIAKTLPPRLVEYDFVFCDSANSMQMELAKFEQAAKLYPRLSWVLLFQTTKDGNFLGEKNWQHAVDVEVYCENGKARALKSRFGGKEEVGVW